ncbi:MAG: ABC transporter ATP-binding protein [Candidatus Magasanikbacteria bacterium]|nr:ABC transporter ATP-binding protein [Candidatus Magasanikbacteria bacterium]
MIQLEHITKNFGGVAAVTDFSVTIKKGEIVGFLGPNGAGKTTTMRMIAGYLSPDSGIIRVAGRSVDDDPLAARRHIGYLPENNPLYPAMTVEDLLCFAADLRGVLKSERRVAFDFVVAAAGLNTVFYRPIGELSKGFRQRVGLAVALLGQPDIIILDEPTEGLDPNQRTEIRALIQELAKEHTVLLSTHVMQEAMAVCRRLLIINRGKLIADGTPDELTRGGEERVFYADLAGNNCESVLRSLSGVQIVQVVANELARQQFKITMNKDSELAPELTREATRSGWVIWGLREEQRGLEQVFEQLTK